MISFTLEFVFPKMRVTRIEQQPPHSLVLAARVESEHAAKGALKDFHLPLLEIFS